MKHLVHATHAHGFCFANGTVIGTNPIEIDDELPGFEDFSKFIGKGLAFALKGEAVKKVLPDKKPVIVAEAKPTEVVAPAAVAVEPPPVAEAIAEVTSEQPKESKKKKAFFNNN